MPNVQRCQGFGLLRPAGFTLIEVLIAGAVVVIGLAAVFVVSGQCRRLSKESRDLSLSSQVLQERMENLRSTMFSGSNSTITSSRLATLIANPTFSGTACFQLTGTESIIVTSAVGSSGSLSASRSVLAGSGTATGSDVSYPAKVELTLTWNEGFANIERVLTRTYITVIGQDN